MNDAGPPHNSKRRKGKQGKQGKKGRRKENENEMVSQYQYSDKNGKRFDRSCPSPALSSSN